MPTMRGPGSPSVGFDGIVHDSSGNDNNGLYGVAGFDFRSAFGATGLVSGDTAVRLGADGGPSYAAVHVPANVVGGPFQLGGAFSVELWLQGNAPDDHFSVGLPGVGDSIILDLHATEFSASYGFDVGIRFSCFSGGAVALTGFPYDGDPHHVVCAAGADDSRFIFLDGVELELAGPGPFSDPPTDRGFGSDFSLHMGDGDGDHGVVDEVAVYEHVLSSGDVAAHYAARGSFAGYTAAVLGDSPAGYYHLNETPPPPSEEATIGFFVGTIAMGGN